METIVRKPLFKPEISFDVSLQEEVEKATVIHCLLRNSSCLRIWPTTYLVQQDGVRKSLLQTYNIPAYPDWKYLRAGHQFTLVFEGLDSPCTVFDFLEDIPEPGGFEEKNIRRNKEDVYWIDIL
jgi:hypothetical protein